MKYLYKCTRNNDKNIISDNISVRIFSPNIRDGLIIQGEKQSYKALVVRLLFQIITHGKMKIFYVSQNDELIHISYMIPKCCKFPFLGTDDYEIGPCYTFPKYRGKGIYTMVLRYICNSQGTEKSVFYMIVDEKNIPSIKGIEKAGFEKSGSVRVTRIMKQYQVEKL